MAKLPLFNGKVSKVVDFVIAYRNNWWIFERKICYRT